MASGPRDPWDGDACIPLPWGTPTAAHATDAPQTVCAHHSTRRGLATSSGDADAPEVYKGRAEAYSEPVPTHRFR